MRKLGVLGVSLLMLMAVSGMAMGTGTFSDDDGNIHEGYIEAIAAEGITRGCNPPVNDRYCPGDAVTRGQMAAFLVRALNLPAASGDWFVDDDDSVFEGDIEALAASGITRGCNPPDNDRFCPDQLVTRGQMAAFLTRAFDYPRPSEDFFTDDDGHVFEGDIEALAMAGVTRGCNPPANDRFCPDDPVLRDQMASFLGRALNLAPITPPSTTTTTTTTTTVPGDLPPPQDVGPVDADGNAEITISNNAPDALTIEFQGPESRTLSMDACPTCIVYLVPPIFCPEEGPEEVLRLAPGVYDVTVRADDPEIGAFAGSWDLQADRGYFSCFYVRRSFG